MLNELIFRSVPPGPKFLKLTPLRESYKWERYENTLNAL